MGSIDGEVKPSGTVTFLLTDIESSTRRVRRCDRPSEPTHVADVLADIRQPVELDGQTVVVSASTGITTSDIVYRAPDEVIRDADLAMYRAKATQTASAVVFDESLRAGGLTLATMPGSSVEGIGIGIVPPLLDLDRFDEVRAVSEEGAFAMARRLAAEEGLLAGGSTGLNVTGAIELARELGPGKTVVTIACDTGLKYLAGDLYRR
jgi:cysteine synthase